MTSAVREFSFRGKSFKVACVEQPNFQHPSWFTYEDEVSVRDELWKIVEGDVVFDIGAAYGSYSICALAVGAEKIYAWSPPQATPPEPDLFGETLDLNGWRLKTVIYRRGLYSKTGWLDAASQAFTVEQPPVLTVDHIRVVTLDETAPREERGFFPGKIDWMKLDVEGAEVEVLRGAEQTIKRYRPRILVENHLFVRKTIGDEVRELLEGWGFKHQVTMPYHSVSHSLYLP